MDTMVQLAVLTVATVIAAAAAIALTWLFLQTTFHLMQPAAASRPAARTARRIVPARSELVHGTRAAARQFAGS